MTLWFDLEVKQLAIKISVEEKYVFDCNLLTMFFKNKKRQKHHSPLLIGEIDRVLLVVVFNLFVQFACLCGQLSDLTPKDSNTVFSIATCKLLYFNSTLTLNFPRSLVIFCLTWLTEAQYVLYMYLSKPR